MTTRIQLDSFTSDIRVYKNMPSTKPNNQYRVAVESLVVPRVCDNLSFDGQDLFTVYRRIERGTPDEEKLDEYEYSNSPLTADVNVNATFVPVNCESVGQVLWQCNTFFEELMLKLISKGMTNRDWNAYNITGISISDDFTPQPNADWHTTVRESNEGHRAQHSIQVRFREDGRIGFRFTEDAMQLFVIRLTDLGQRVFSWPNRFIAWHPSTGSFREPYAEEGANGDVIQQPVVPDVLDGTTVFMDGSLYDTVEIRHELVLATDVPVPPIVQFTQDVEKLSNQIASYRYSITPETMSYNFGEKLMGLKSTSSNILILEDTTPSSNSFYLSHTDMQNFHVNLVSRDYKYVNGEYVMTEEKYKLPDNSYWYMTLAITPV